MKTLLVLVLSFFQLAQAGSLSCEVILSGKYKVGEDFIKTKALVFQSNDGQREMAYRYSPPASPSQETKVVVHGLGDSMRDMMPLIDGYLKQGHGVLTIDQYGHGETLDLLLARHKGEEPLKDYNYMNNSHDLHDLIVRLGIHDFYLMGHSLGGNVVFFTAARFAELGESKKYGLKGVVPMAPYAGRTDKYFVDYMRSPEYWVEGTSSKIVNAGADGQLVDKILDPYYRLFALLKKYPKFMQDVYYNLLGVQIFKDAMQDPIMDKLLIVKYREYFTKKAKAEKGENLTKEDLEHIEIQAEVSLGIAKVNRSIDLLNSFEKIPKIDVPIYILAARNDRMVLTSQMKEFKLRLEKADLNVELEIIDGRDADHFFPQKHAEEVAQKIQEHFAKLQSEKKP